MISRPMLTLLICLLASVFTHTANAFERPPTQKLYYVDKAGKIIFRTPGLTWASWFSQGFARVQCNGPSEDGRINSGSLGFVGFVDENGKPTFGKYFGAGPFSEGLAFVTLTKDGSSGFIDTKGKLAIPAQYTGSSGFSGGVAAVKSDGKWGYVNRNGKFTIQPRFDNAFPFHEGLAVAELDKKCVYIDPFGNVVKCPLVDSAQSVPDPQPGVYPMECAEGLGVVQVEGKRGYINALGIIAIKPEFDFADNFKEGLAAVYQNGKYGYIDKTGKTVIQFQYEQANRFSEGLASVRLGNKWGFIDNSGKTVITPSFDDARSFSENMAAVMIGKKWGFIDKSGQLLIQPKFDGALFDFSDGRALVFDFEKEQFP